MDFIFHGILLLFIHFIIYGLNILLRILYLYKGKEVIIKYRAHIDRHDLLEAHGVSILYFSKISDKFIDCFVINPFTSFFYGLDVFKGKCIRQGEGISVEIDGRYRRYLDNYEMLSYLFVNGNCSSKALLIINIVSLKSMRNSLSLLRRWYFGKIGKKISC